MPLSCLYYCYAADEFVLPGVRAAVEGASALCCCCSNMKRTASPKASAARLSASPIRHVRVAPPSGNKKVKRAIPSAGKQVTRPPVAKSSAQVRKSSRSTQGMGHEASADGQDRGRGNPFDRAPNFVNAVWRGFKAELGHLGSSTMVINSGVEFQLQHKTFAQVKPSADGIEGYLVLPERLIASAIFWSVTPQMPQSENATPKKASSAVVSGRPGYRHHFRLTTAEDMIPAFRTALQQAYSHAEQLSAS